MQQAKTPFHIMAKPRGPICNLACEYCYYLPKAKLYPKSDFRMDLELLENFTRQTIESQPGGQVTINWQGGEPTLMGLDFFKHAVRLQKMIASANKQIVNALQTNGTTINPAWCQFFKQNNFLIGLSLDGPPSVHNIYRRNNSGREKYDSVMRAARLLKHHKVEFNILCCVHNGNQDYPLEVYRFLRDKVGATFIQFIPVIQRELDAQNQETQSVTNRSVNATAYGDFLQTVFDEWVLKDVGKIFVQIFDVALGVWSGQPSSLCVFSKTCGRALVLEHNGDLYACDHFVNKDHLLGNIAETSLVDLVDSQRQDEFGRAKRITLPQECLDCNVRFICNGGCPKNRDATGINLLCEGYQNFFRHIDRPMQMMRNLLQNRRAPSEIMHLYKPNPHQ